MNPKGLFISLITLLASLVLFLFTLRRWIFLWAAWLKPHNPLPAFPATQELPSVLLLTSFYNEAANLPPMLEHLASLFYPPDKLMVVLIDDGSTDSSLQLCQQWLAGRSNSFLLSLNHNVGKAAALNAALSRYPQGAVVAVYDADERPLPDALHQLLQPFADERVGAVSGRRAVSNPLASPLATYATFENLVHQRVTMQAKDSLGLAPAALGSNCAYRRTALAAVGGFRPGALLEDSDVTVRLAQAGWYSRFVPQSLSHHTVPASLAGYWRQHVRWASGFNAVAQDEGMKLLRAGRLPWPLRLELFVFSLGYLDRPALAVAAAVCWGHLARRGRPPRLLWWLLLSSLLTPFLQVLVALRLERAPLALWPRVIFLPLFLAFDVAAATLTLLQSTDARFHHSWRRHRRPGLGL